MKTFVRNNGLFVFLLIIGITLRLIFISHHGLSNDELSAWFRTRYTKWDDFWYFGVTNGDMHPVFYQALLWVWVRLFGELDWTIRLTSMLFFIMNMSLIYMLAIRHFTKQAAYLPIILYSTLTFLIVNTTLARPYNSGSFFVLLSFLAVLEIHRSTFRNWRWIACLAIGFIGAMLSHYFAFLTVGVLGLASLWMLNKNKKWDILLSGALAVLLFLPHLTVTIHHLQRGGLQWLAPPKWDWLLEVLVLVSNHSILGACIIVGMVFWVIFTVKGQKSQFASRLAILLICGTIVLGYIISYTITPVLRELVILFVLPFPLLWLGQRIRLQFYSVLVITVLISIHTIFVDSLLGFQHFGDFKWLGKEINGIQKTYGKSSISTANNFNNVAYINYYVKEDLTEDIVNWDDVTACNRLYERVQQSQTPYFLYVKNNAFHTEQFIEIIRSRYPVLIKKKWFGNSLCVLFKREARPPSDEKNLSFASHQEFIYTNTSTISKFSKVRPLFIQITAKVSGRGEVYAVATIERNGMQLMKNGTPIIYQTFDLNQTFQNQPSKGKAYLGFNIPLECKPTDVLKWYIWNPNKYTVHFGKWTVGQR